jgi:hypothetical protein
MKNFWASLQGRIVGWLIVLAILMGIYAEAIVAYKNTKEAKTATETANNAAKLKLAEAEERLQLARKAAADAETARAAADNAAKLKLAEAEERAQLAKKAAADAEAARAAADNAAKLRLAEAEERLQKSRTAKAEADVSPEMQAATVAAKQAEARKLDGEATQAQYIACAMDVSKCTPEQRCITEGITDAGKRGYVLNLAAADRFMGGNSIFNGMGYNKACLHLADKEQPAPSQIPPNCRQDFANWQRYKSHAAFAVQDSGYCAWNGDNVYQGSTAEAVASLKDYCNKRKFVCTIIATK